MAKVTLTHEQEQDFLKRYTDGSASLSSIADEIGCSIPTVSRRLRKLGAVIRGRGRPQGTFGPKRVASATNVPVIPAAVLAEEERLHEEKLVVAVEASAKKETEDSRYSW